MSATASGARRNPGFTLVEMMVVVMILGMVSVGLFQVLTTSRASYEQQQVTLEMQQNARAAIEPLADDFRHVSYGKDATQPSINYAGPDSVTFVADVMPEVSGAERVSFFLSPDGDPETPNPHDTILMKVVADSGGTVLFTEAQSYGIQSGGLHFKYFNGAGVELANPVPQPELIGEAMIEVTAVEPRAHPRSGTYLTQTLSTTVYPRNLPLTPARSRPSTPAVGPLTVPNCESVTVPWTRPTTNTDGTPLPLEDVSHFTLYMGTSADSQTVYCRVARTITTWTVTGLVGNTHYHFGVTCTSRSGVESYKGRADIDLTNALVPTAPSGLAWLNNPSGAGIKLTWNPVTTFVGGSPITTSLTYHVYRGTAPGVAPVPQNQIATVPTSTWYADTGAQNCNGYYYVVTAEACGSRGAVSNEVAASRPAICSPVGALVATLGAQAGSVDMQWNAPTTRVDGSALTSGEITGYRIFYDTTPYAHGNHLDVPASPTHYLVVGLQTCTTFYLNAAAIDACGHVGQISSGNELSLRTSEPCDPDIPLAPARLTAHAVGERIDLVWPANTVDCDLLGYRVYYGTTPGGPYTGSGAVEGPSPVFFEPGFVTQGDSCRASLSGLEACRTYSIVVKAIDLCQPPNQSAASPERTLPTDCTPCTVDAGCVRYLATGSGFPDVNLELYTTNGVAATLTEIVPEWTGTRRVSQVWAGRPLIKVWAGDGSAGGDGAVGNQSSGAKLNVNDFAVPATADAGDGLPLMLRFDGDQRTQTLALSFHTNGGRCDATARPIVEGMLLDDFNDGNYNGWTVESGTWSAATGELYHSKNTNTGQILRSETWGDMVYEAKIKVTSGQSPYLVFRYYDTQNFYLLNLRTIDDQLRFSKYQNGVFSTTAQVNRALDNDVWYMVRVVVTGRTALAYLDCNLVMQVTDNAMKATGKAGLRTYQTKAYFDDVRVTVANPLP
jgi:prepilin-type N-terminal cleavage/methylation domain-containing protein